MRTPRVVIVGLGIVLLWSAACSTASSTAVCGNRPYSPPTQTNGPLSIATDHNVYAPADVMVVVLTNHVQPDSVVMGLSRYCPYVALQQLQGTTWKPVAICFPEDISEANPGTPALRLGPEQSYTIHLVDMTESTTPTRRPFPTGTFRLVVTYRPGLDRGAVAYSDDVWVCTCGTC
jgi:hypothetical protein